MTSSPIALTATDDATSALLDDADDDTFVAPLSLPDVLSAGALAAIGPRTSVGAARLTIVAPSPVLVIERVPTTPAAPPPMSLVAAVADDDVEVALDAAFEASDEVTLACVD